MEGIIKEEDDQRVILNVGPGTITIPRDSIEQIESSAGQEEKELQDRWFEKYCTNIEYAPFRLRDLARAFNDLERLRNDALREKKARRLSGKKTEEQEKEGKELYRQYLAVNEKLRAADPQTDVKTYNELVAEYNILNARIKLYEQEKQEKQAEDRRQEDTVAYHSALVLLKDSVASRKKDLADDLTGKELVFFDRLSEKIKKMEEDFDSHTIPLIRKGNNFLAQVRLDKRVTARLLVDTGASLILISDDIARRLNVARNKESFFWLTLANGEKVKAFPVRLASVEAGGVRADNVQAAVLEKSFSGMEDGLLGMSFLGRFAVRIDSSSPSLILEDFTP